MKVKSPSLPNAAAKVAFSLIGSFAFFASDTKVSAQTILVSDDFSLTGSRTVGDELNGFAPQTGSGTWTSPFTGTSTSQFFEFTNSGTLVQSVNNSTESRIAISPGTDIVTVTAEMTSYEGGWSGIAITQDLTNSVFASQTNVLGRIQNNAFLMGNSTNFDAHGSTIASFGWDKLYTLELSYDPTLGEARFQVLDGNTIVGTTGWQSGFSGTVGAAAVSMRGTHGSVNQTVTPYVNSFEVSAIPEPGTAAAWIGALALLAVGLRRRRPSAQR